jgi:hypothetical protein
MNALESLCYSTSLFGYGGFAMLEPTPPEPYDEQWRQVGDMSAMAAETPDINDLAARLERVEKFQHSTAYAQMLRIEQVQAQVAAPAAALASSTSGSSRYRPS